METLESLVVNDEPGMQDIFGRIADAQSTRLNMMGQLPTCRFMQT